MNRSRTMNTLYKVVLAVVGVLGFLCIILNPNNEKFDNIYESRETKTFFSVYHQSLCEGKTKIREVSEVPRKCPQGGIVTVNQGGRLGNQIWEYASVWAVSKLTGLEPYVPGCIRNTIDELFENLSIPALEDISHCEIRFVEVVKGLEAWSSPNQSIILPIYSRLFDIAVPFIEEIKMDFQIRKTVLERCQQILREAAKLSSYPAQTFVGVHVRRTDYMTYLNWKYQNVTIADQSYFLRAMEIFEGKFENVIFVVLSDDLSWCRNAFSGKGNVYINKMGLGNSAVVDLALMASCNHTIYDYGTYGDWGALLAGGDNIYFNLSVNPSAQMGKMLPNWSTI
ncbi:unnamed protein product [Phaedon cochleariae]|uniref:L-Fucosyltransferase n=1 Tax=Phaedon cochleariae TaxID=80249 RepID=A0A9N9SG81_PHACE|nr:unnamed protein product [Phaedon cochleariae]